MDLKLDDLTTLRLEIEGITRKMSGMLADHFGVIQGAAEKVFEALQESGDLEKLVYDAVKREIPRVINIMFDDYRVQQTLVKKWLDMMGYEKPPDAQGLKPHDAIEPLRKLQELQEEFTQIVDNDRKVELAVQAAELIAVQFTISDSERARHPFIPD